MKSRGAPRPPPFDAPRSPSFFKAVYESVNVFGSTLWVTGTVAEPGTLYALFLVVCSAYCQQISIFYLSTVSVQYLPQAQHNGTYLAPHRRVWKTNPER